ncbi:uncharacterized protein FOMMEDRAFT_168382 [Fomitiporia mediterranea MF3/22]|uniref:uncharacterized protein n=1 Tax=Fomitiporia mediterranea (strain MF3/22) TaxID=694068 RepID=UPI0004408EA6|nr:uncharacterized protein FOMMEDRAFT_168382 [Fomitiporia mediterranea MF3/22]EJD03442.1 hypothetical protein FOMMEDRAFT_168382 [Fomitiporia mediterranea MF3/22]
MDPAEQRANAVAMLRRAASLPRMKDGRRPPMHGEAGGVSEGERSHSREKTDIGSRDEQKPVELATSVAPATSLEPESARDPEPVAATADEKDGDDATDAAQEISEPERPTSTTPDKPSKRRSRSRSRSRGSRDMRAKMRQLEIASQAEASTSSVAGAIPGMEDIPPISSPSPQLTSPQAYLMQLQMAAAAAQAPQLLSPLSPFGYAAALPAGGAGMAGMPSLQALQTRHLQGLFRSNSAAARLNALKKLTGEVDTESGPASASPAPGPSPSPSPGPVKRGLTRNNTVAGEERVAARQQLLRRLNEGIRERGDIDLTSTSGTEDASSGTQTPKSRRRRSRRKSGSAVVDDRDGTNAASVLALKEVWPPLIPPPASRTPSVPPERQQVTPSPGPPSAPRSQTSTPLFQIRQYDSPMADRGPVVEEEDDDPLPTPPRVSRQPIPGASATTTASVSSSSGDAGSAPGDRVPVVLSDPSQRSPFRQDVFPKSPFERPREEPDEEQERVLYGGDTTRARNKAADDLLEREISWVAEPVPTVADNAFEGSEREISWNAEAVPEVAHFNRKVDRDVSWVEQGTLDSRMPVYDEDEDDENDDEVKASPAVAAQSTSRQQSARPSPRTAGESQELLIDLETTPDHTPSDLSTKSKHSTASTATRADNTRESNVSDMSVISAHRLDTSSPLDRTHSQADSIVAGWHDFPNVSTDTSAPPLTSKRSADSTGGGTSTWSKMKQTFARSGSSLGRRSRTNSIAREKRGDTESSRESGASLISGKRESKGDGQWQQQQQGGQTQAHGGQGQRAPSPGAPGMMLAPLPPPRTGVSPIPPPSDSDATKYRNPKLFPFPGVVKLQEEALRSKAAGANVGLSASSPDISMQTGVGADGSLLMRSANSSVSSQHMEVAVRDRKLSHQASDSQLLSRYQLMPGPGTISGAPSSGGAQIDYFAIPQPPPSSNVSSTLPFTREGVKKWLNARLFPSNSQQGGHAPTPSPGIKPRAETVKKPSLSDLLGRSGNISDLEDIDKTRAATSASTSTVVAQSSSANTSREGEIQESSPDDPMQAYQFANAFPHAPEPDTDAVVDAYDPHEPHESRHLSAPLSSSHDPSSATPDPASSEESPSHSSQRSASSLDSLFMPEETPPEATPQAVDILQRLDQVLHADYHNRLWSSALNSPPRRLLLSSPMLQVANCNTVKDRFLFLFTDLLVIAKPMLPDRDSLVDPQKVYPPDRKFFIKNVVHLKDIKLNVDREEDTRRPTSALISQRPEFIRKFVQEFAEDPDPAVSKLVDLRDPKGHITLGRLLVQLPEIDRAKLGEYLSRRTSKVVLKAYLDAFGFTGINIEAALRIFLLSIHIPSGSGHANTLETLLDMFAGRWYEANAGIVAFDRDLALRLVRAIVRLNEALHAAISHDLSSLHYSRPHVTARDFTEAFRRHDPRLLVPDSTLEKIYTSVRHEKLCQARNPTNGRAPLPISLKRPVPSRVTYRRQSEPIVVRIPQIDPLLTIQLFGQDLTFDPPVLTFAKSTESSFRVTGSAFGSKTMVMSCAGPNAPNYSGMPLSTNIAVERAFMRNTFQLAFIDVQGKKRKYMFSVDDPVIRHEWTGSLKRQIEAARIGSAPGLETPPPGTGSAQMQVYRAAELLSFSVLQDTLLAQAQDANNTGGGGAVGSVNGTVRRTPKQGWVSPFAGADTAREQENMHMRSRSRSQIYRHGAGRHEYEPPLNGNTPGSTLPEDRPPSDLDLLGDSPVPGPTVSAPEANARLWTGAELELVCQQNSAIALVLSFLQAALPFDVEEDAAANNLNNGGVNNGMNGPVGNVFAPQSVQRNLSQSSAYQI